MNAAPAPAMPVGIGETLPAIFADDHFIQAFAGAMDTMFAPLINALDCLHAYLDPALAPESWLPWLGAWVTADQVGSSAQMRRSIARAAVEGRRRGTRYALEDDIIAIFGIQAEIIENGAGGWSRSSYADMPGHATPTLRVRVSAADNVDGAMLRAIVERHRPAHVPVHIEVVPESGGRRARQPG